ncbi:MAG: histidine phosphatase family protein [Hyphomicrobiaceae bacterium]
MSITRRRFIVVAASGAASAAYGAGIAAADETAWNALRSDGAIVLFRHATAPGIGDPAGMRIGDCATQRNLNEAGRAEARGIGQAFRDRSVSVGKVLTSQWCRCAETAELAFPGAVTPEPAFNSFFEDRAQSGPQTEAARSILGQWRGPGALVVVTHQVNIDALTGAYTASGEGVVVRVADGAISVIGRIKP